MQPRERFLVGVIVCLLALGGGYWVVSGVYSHFSNVMLRRDQLQGELDQMDFQLQRGRQMAEKQLRWRQQSLPTDLALARSHYQNWLLALAAGEDVQFRNTDVSSSRSYAREGIYRKLPFTIRGEGDLRQLTTFLYRFYQGDHLHKITRMTVKPMQGSDQLDLVITIEALSLPDADRKDRLAEGTSNRLGDNALDEYATAIVGRNLFAPYRPPDPARERGPTRPVDPEIDPARFAFVSGVIQPEGGRPQVWINLRTLGKVLKLSEGDEFRVSDQNYRVVRIHPRWVEIETNGRRVSVAFGHNLTEGVDLPATTAAG